MPIPKPIAGEQQGEFMERCISTIIDEYGNEQAVAICSLQWEESMKEVQKQLKFKDIRVSDIKADMQENIISGYASHFNNKDSHNDIIVQGAFKKTISENKNRIKVLLQHNMWEPIGKPQEMEEDKKGLFTVSKISLTDAGKNTMILARDGVLDEMSIGYIPIKEKWDDTKQANIISEIKLLEYSIVTLASNELARLTDVKHILGEYQYSKGNVMDIVAMELLKSIKALVKGDEPSKDTLTDKKSQEIDQIMAEIKKYL